MSGISDRDFGARFWLSQWEYGVGPFSAATRGDLLGTHWPVLKVPAGSRVLVPLAGKTPDLWWLAQHGFDAVGVEISPIACAQFFAEQHIEAQRTSEPPFERWYGGGVTLLQGNFFELDGTFAAALDRGSLVVFPQDVRRSYVMQLRSLLTDGGAVMLVTIEFDANRVSGPPFPVLADEVAELFPGAVERARHELRRPKWESVGGAEVVVWSATVSHDEN